MIEVVFGESAYGSLKVAQGYGKGKYQSGAVSVFMANTDGVNPSKEEIQEIKQQVEDCERKNWEMAVPLESGRGDAYCFDMALSVGDISDDGLGEQRSKVLKQMLSVGCVEDIDALIDEKMQNTANALTAILERYSTGEEVRIWYSDNPDEICGMYWFMAQFQTVKKQTAIYMVKLPEWEYGEENTIISRTGWGEIAPGEWGKYISLQEKVQPVFLSVCAMKWRKLRQENAPLRAILNGQLQSVSEEIYDSFILREIAVQENEFKMAVVIGNVMGKYQLGIGDVWIAGRIEKMIDNGELEVVSEAPEGGPIYRRILRKRGNV